MELIGTAIVWIIMACMVAGGVVSMVKPESELGRQFFEGINAIGPIFFSVAGIFASIPYLTIFIDKVFGPFFGLFGADPSLAATTLIAVDMGGYQVADALAQTREGWIMAMYTGFMAGATIVYSMPIGLRVCDKKDHKYFALGTMCGFVALPFGVLIASVVSALSHPMIREIISTNAPATYQLALSFTSIFQNLIPLFIICILIAIGLKVVPGAMVKGFMIFGRAIDYAARTVLILSILQQFTGIFTVLFGGWGFDPLMADEENLVRAIEVVCSVGLMLAGAFPMVYLIKTYLAKPLGKIGRLFHLSDMATSGMLATSCNAIALFPMIRDMEPIDKVKCLAFTVCGAFLIGDHLSFCANFQPTLIAPLFIGKFCAAVLAVVFVRFLAYKETMRLQAEDEAEQRAIAQAVEKAKRNASNAGSQDATAAASAAVSLPQALARKLRLSTSRSASGPASRSASGPASHRPRNVEMGHSAL